MKALLKMIFNYHYMVIKKKLYSILIGNKRKIKLIQIRIRSSSNLILFESTFDSNDEEEKKKDWKQIMWIFYFYRIVGWCMYTYFFILVEWLTWH
jgi:hypothetical protein